MSKDPDHVILLRAALHLMREVDRGPFVKSIFECTAIWDGVECDGYCLKEDIENWFEQEGIDAGMTEHEKKLARRRERRAALAAAKGTPE